MSTDPNPVTHARRNRPPLFVERQIDISQPAAASNRRDAVRINRDVDQVTEVNDERPVGPAETVGSVGVTSSTGRDGETGLGGAGKGGGDLVLRERVEDRGWGGLEALVVGGCSCVGIVSTQRPNVCHGDSESREEVALGVRFHRGGRRRTYPSRGPSWSTRW